MSKIKISEEGVAALNQFRDGLTEGAETIKNSTNTLEDVLDENKEGLGPHSDSISSIIAEIRQTNDEAAASIVDISEMLQTLMDSFNTIINNDRYGGK